MIQRKKLKASGSARTFCSHLEWGNLWLTFMTISRKSTQNFLLMNSRMERGTRLTFMSTLLAIRTSPLPTPRGTYSIIMYLQSIWTYFSLRRGTNPMRSQMSGLSWMDWLQEKMVLLWPSRLNPTVSYIASLSDSTGTSYMQYPTLWLRAICLTSRDTFKSGTRSGRLSRSPITVRNISTGISITFSVRMPTVPLSLREQILMPFFSPASFQPSFSMYLANFTTSWQLQRTLDMNCSSSLRSPRLTFSCSRSSSLYMPSTSCSTGMQLSITCSLYSRLTSPSPLLNLQYSCTCLCLSLSSRAAPRSWVAMVNSQPQASRGSPWWRVGCSSLWSLTERSLILSSLPSRVLQQAIPILRINFYTVHPQAFYQFSPSLACPPKRP